MNKKYFKAIDSLVPRDESVEKVIEVITEAEQSGKEFEMKKTKKYNKFTAIGTIAASLAIVIALGAFFYPKAINESKTSSAVSDAVVKKGFFIKANAVGATGDEAKAEKITSEKFVKIGKFIPTVGFVLSDTEKESMSGLFNYDLRCEGDNIDKITYKIANSAFCIKNGYKPVVSKGKKSTFDKDLGLTVGDEGEYNCWGCYTVDYDNQPDLSKYTNEATDSIKSPIQIIGAVKYKNEPKTSKNSRDNKKWSNYYNSIFKNTVITVTAVFKDGKTQSQNLQLNCNYKSADDITVEAKIIK